MKIYCISDSIETALGLKLSGVQSIVLNQKNDIDLKIEEIMEDRSIGILVITENVYELSKEKIDYIREFRRIPLIVKV